MKLSLRPPLFVLAMALLGLILLLATLQYVWLGRITEGERERLRATLASRTAEFAQDFDRELTRAYLLFQADPPRPDPELPRDGDAAARFAERHDRWMATSAYPRLIKDVHVATRRADGGVELRRYDPATRALQAAPWPAAMADWRTRLDDRSERIREGGVSSLVIRRLAGPVWETVPALVVPVPMLFVTGRGGRPDLATPEFSYTLLTIDVEYARNELFPALAQRHFRKSGDASEYQVAVVDAAGSGAVLYRSTPAFSPGKAENGDAHAGLFQVRTQDFGAVAAEVRRFAAFTASTTTKVERQHDGRETRDGRPVRAPSQLSIVVQQGDAPATPSFPARQTATAARWQVVVKHPAGSLDAFVSSTRRRNLAVSMSILGVLAASMALLIVSTRRSQELARQQLEFVAAVSHELRTPLAVIRSAGENLADGVVHDEAHVKKYGGLIRAEGRRLSEMVEQILELAGIHSGQRRFARAPVAIAPLVDDVLSGSAALIEEARIRVELDVPADLPPVSGDAAALRRVFQNLIGNAIKYGALGGWIGVRARRDGSHVAVTVTDKGIGIAAAEQERIFEPFYRAGDVVAARIQGAGLGLSLVQRIVDGHGGRIAVESAPGEGSEFTVTLPVAADDAAETVRAAEGPAEPARTT